MKAVVIVTADWCGPCKSLKPKIESVTQANGVKLIRIDGGADREFAAKLGVRSVPVVILYNGGKEVGRWAGDRSEGQIESALMRAGLITGDFA